MRPFDLYVRNVFVLAMAVAGLSLHSTAQGQSRVEIYGIVDSGVAYVSNQGGSSAIAVVGGGGDRPNRIGFRGSEDLGGGLRANFVLENGFNVATGGLGQGGLLFGRQAYVALQDSQLGEIRVGRQYDFMIDLVPYTAAASGNGGFYSFHLGDLDRLGGERLNNSVQYRTPNVAGLQAGVLYSFGGVAGDFSRNSARSFGATYKYGSFQAGAAYTSVNNFQAGLGAGVSVLGNSLVGPPVNANFDRIDVYGAGASYQFDKLYTAALFTSSSLRKGGGSAILRAYDIGATYQVMPATFVGAALTYYTMSPNRWIVPSASVDYDFSKRTNVYLQFVSMHVSGPNAVAELFVLPASASRSQTAITIGMRHNF
ncbi:Outer membrane porin protein [Pandoraea terrae]|uniref:Outer membrane porin protein n=1 Tax=Pandoraea terrae TaxID=1537710 RepID=A0A5E4SZC3_9BURK|nr:porin [Pandoraea terrae]VVD80422.1 Outer membrane porin protein [Pandoraea terrae]